MGPEETRGKHDQLFKAALIDQPKPFLEIFFPEEAAQLDLAQLRFVDKELFSAPPMGPGREVDLLAEVPLRAASTPAETAGASAGSEALVAIWIEVQAQRELGFLWRALEYYALLGRLRGLPVLPILFFPIEDVLGREHGRRPRVGYERVALRQAVLGHDVLRFAPLAITLPALDASAYLARPQALAGALAALMRRPAHTPPSAHKLVCLRRIIEGSGVEREESRRLLNDVVETYLRLAGAEAERFEVLLRRPENEGVRRTMKTWSEEREEIGEARGREIGAKRKAQEYIIRFLEARFGPLPPTVAERIGQIDDQATLDALAVRVATASTLDKTGLL